MAAPLSFSAALVFSGVLSGRIGIADRDTAQL
jgi:hypothetical protein